MKGNKGKFPYKFSSQMWEENEGKERRLK